MPIFPVEMQFCFWRGAGGSSKHLSPSPSLRIVGDSLVALGNPQASVKSKRVGRLAPDPHGASYLKVSRHNYLSYIHDCIPQTSCILFHLAASVAA